MDEILETDEGLTKKRGLKRGAAISPTQIRSPKNLISDKGNLSSTLKVVTPKIGGKGSIKISKESERKSLKKDGEKDKPDENQKVTEQIQHLVDDSLNDINSSENDLEDSQYIEQNSEDEIKARLNQKREAMGDDFNLKKVFSHEKEPQAYDPIGNQAGFVLVLLYLSIYTIVMTQITFRTGDAYEISASIRAIFENYPIDTESRTYGEISDKYNIIDFFNNILIKQIFDESVKKFESGQDGYHYINNYNYFGGMRLTHNRVDLKRYSRDSLHDWTRRKNYQGRTNQRFTSINTDYFWLEDKEYSQHGGYFDKGGFIYFLKSDTTYEEATAFSDNAEYNWMFDEEYLTLTFEIMFYNQNLQTGVFICYEFLNNNAAVIEKHVFVDSFFVSAYSSYNNIFASWSITFIIVLDVIWLI